MRTIPQPPKMLAHDVHWNSINRGIILKDIVDTEKANVAELQGLVDNFLQPLASTNILTEEEFSQLIGNLLEVLEIHEYLLKLLERALLQGSMSKVGDRFLMLASRINEIHQSYCDHHPLAVCILDKYRKELNAYMEEKGAVSPGILVLTTGLSKPLRRLEKYSAMFQELERYTERCHPDKGNVQRCIILYREIAETCASIRRRKELALQVLMGGIEDWDGEELGSIDEILHVGLVTLVMGEELRTRYLVLSPTALHILSTNQTMSSFVYECKLPLGTITITPMANTEETRNAFTISDLADIL
ncbi:rho guanine nucleotide exchange factor 7 isoform X2 [Orussus abietinus]|uniref:rho guanine nucleotide exchange factor 7 isoform X2 n=1 Tax=Orussus abietinus TaxID=222816 RepID=UPI0006253971|nr:rho guanine nucleotide exchange factor 7 isoform X2 [Orussus abietinus]